MPSFSLLARSLRNLGKCATSGFPDVREPTPPRFRGRPEVSEDCMGCQACAEQCPSGAIRTEPRDITSCGGADADPAKFGTMLVLTVEVARCLFCGRCQEVCPKEAVKLGGCYDFSTQHPSGFDLRREVALAACGVCGRPFAPRGQLEWVGLRVVDQIDPSVRDAVKADLPAYRDLCPDCRRTISIRLNTHTEKYI